MYQEKLLLVFAQSLIGVGFILLYIQHVRGVFEARTNIVHLTQLERESLFQREDALHYSFYKTISEAPTFLSGYMRLQNLSNIEYPHSINVIHRFHVLPEIIIGALYHFLRSHQGLNVLPLLSCWHSASDNLQLQSTIAHSYQLCENQSMQFYTECVWLLGGLTIFIIYMYGLLLSRNVFGGIYAVASYAMFHNFAAKIYERPAARENFAFPVILMQMFCLCACINQYQRKSKGNHHGFSTFMIVQMTCLTAIALLCWQFSTVIFATQILIMMLKWCLYPIENRSVHIFLYEYAFTQLAGIFIAYTMSNGNKRYIFAWQLGPAVALFFISIMRYIQQRFTIITRATINRKNSNKLSLSVKIIPLGILISLFSQSTLIDVLEVTGFVRSIENSYVLYRDLFIHWLFQAKINFITTLTACNPEHRRVNGLELWSFVKTLIIKPYCVYGAAMLANFFRKWRKTSSSVTSGTSSKESKADIIERAKNYLLEDFLEEHHISMTDVINHKNEHLLHEYLQLLSKCNYDYDLYKKERMKMATKTLSGSVEYSQFLDNIKQLKLRIQQQEETITRTAGKDVKLNKLQEETEISTLPLNVTNIATTTTNNMNKIHSDKNENISTINIDKSSKEKGGTDAKPTNLRNDYYINNFHYKYTFLQMIVFTIIGLNIRKLFFLCFTNVCILTSTICSLLLNVKNSNNNSNNNKQNQEHKQYKPNYNLLWSFNIYVFLSSILYPGILNIHEEYYTINQELAKDYRELNVMLEWIKLNTENDAVFAVGNSRWQT